MTTPPFDELVGPDVPNEERERLRRVHELLVAAGPPPELTERLASPPGFPRDPSVPVLPPNVPRRRLAASLVLAAALVLASFGAGYLLGDRGLQEDALAVDFVVPMRGTPAAPAARASLEVFERDDAGNWPMRLTVRNLAEGGYDLYLTRKGRLADLCGSFRVEGAKTVVPLNAPYRLRGYDGWVVVPHGGDRVLLTDDGDEDDDARGATTTEGTTTDEETTTDGGTTTDDRGRNRGSGGGDDDAGDDSRSGSSSGSG